MSVSTSELIHIVYISFTDEQWSEHQLDSLLESIRFKNDVQEVTGLLLYNDRSFIQVIEGEKRTIRSLFKKITKDQRHNTVVSLLEEPISERMFPNWSMGFRRINKTQSDSIKGFTDFMDTENGIRQLRGSTNEVMHLLSSFKEYS